MTLAANRNMYRPDTDASAQVRGKPEARTIAIVATTALTLRSFLLPYVVHLRSKGWQVHGIAAGVDECTRCRETFDRVHEVAWSRSPANLRAAMAGMRGLRRVLSAYDFDIVHVHTPVAAFLTRFVLRHRGSRPKVVYTAHGFHFNEHGSAASNGLYRLMERVAGQWTDHLVVINRDDERAAAQHGIVPATRLTYMPGIGIEIDQYEHRGESDVPDSRLFSGAPSNGALRFLCVGEFNKGKRHRDLVRAFAKVRADGARLAFAGVGPEIDRVRALATSLGVVDRIDFLGYRRDVPALLRTSAALLLCSEREGLPRSVMEAMAAGTPVIGTNVRGIRDLLGDGAGFLVPVGDCDAIAAAMMVVATDSARAAQMVQNARRRIEAYSLGALLTMHDALYERLLTQRG